MSDTNLTQRSKTALHSSANLDELLLIVRQFKHEGGTQEEAEQSLMNLLSEDIDEPSDDLIREVLDFVTGWCQPSNTIWPE
ncbi:MAG: hypothetical protein AAF597_00750 [Bacteroidota bacterium]